MGWWKTTKQNTTFTLGVGGISISTPTTPETRTQVLNPQWLADAMATRIELDLFFQHKKNLWNSTHHLMAKGNDVLFQHITWFRFLSAKAMCSKRLWEMIWNDTVFLEEILHQLVGRLSHYLQGLKHPRWCRISAINSSNGQKTK